MLPSLFRRAKREKRADTEALLPDSEEGRSPPVPKYCGKEADDDDAGNLTACAALLCLESALHSRSSALCPGARINVLEQCFGALLKLWLKLHPQRQLRRAVHDASAIHAMSLMCRQCMFGGAADGVA